MKDFEITDSKGRRFKVSPMYTVAGGFYLSDTSGHCQEIGQNQATNKWLKLAQRVSLSQFEFDIEEIGELIEDNYRR
jgi:hypothetical protein